MRRPYRIVVWGPGGGGNACIRAALKMREIELVGVLVYSESKVGKDIGELVGLRSVGVKATADRDEIYRLKPECVLYTARDFGNFNFDDEIVEILEAGIDVVASPPFQYLKARGIEVIHRFEAACRKGGSTLYGTGINPGFMFERLALTATGASNHITEILLEEFIRTGAAESQETMEIFGFGLPIEQAQRSETAVKIAEQYERQFLYYAGDVLGIPISSLSRSSTFQVTPVEVQAPTMVLKANTVAFAMHRWEGVSESGVRLAFQTHWYMSDALKPEGVPCDDYYRITIEGEPSLRLGIELKASIAKNLRVLPEEPTVPYFRVLAVTMLQAVPGTCAAPPGIQLIAPPSNAYWRADLRAKPFPAQT